MTEHWFYHLESATLEAVLPNLLEKTLERGWTALVKTSPEQIKYLDDFLWSYKDNSFLPHGRDDQPLADQNPVRLSFKADSAQGADIVLITDGSEIEDLSGVKRCIFIIDGRSETAITAARGRWTRLKKTASSLSYWQQNDLGAWQKKA